MCVKLHRKYLKTLQSFSVCQLQQMEQQQFNKVVVQPFSILTTDIKNQNQSIINHVIVMASDDLVILNF